MALLSRHVVAEFLACPRCHGPLTDAFRCEACGSAYPTVAAQPVLIDFHNSIVAENEIGAREAGSAIQRGRSKGLKRSITKALTPENRVAARNAARLTALAKHDRDRPSILVIGGGSAG